MQDIFAYIKFFFYYNKRYFESILILFNIVFFLLKLIQNEKNNL